MRTTLLILLLAAGLAPASAVGQDAPLVVDTQDLCPSAVLEDELARLLHRPLAPEDGTARVAVRAIETRIAVVIELTPPGGSPRERRIEGESCEAVLRAAALVIALSLVPDLVLEVPAEPTPVTPPPAPPRAPLPDLHERAVGLGDPRALPPGERLFFVADVSAGVFVGGLPEPAFAGRLRLGIEVGQLLVRASVEARGPATARSPTRLDLGGTFALVAGRLSVGGVFAWGPVRLVPELGLEAGGIYADGFGSELDHTGWGEWLAPVVGVEGALCPIEALCVVLDAELLLALVRPVFVIDNHEPTAVFQPPEVAGLFSLGIQLHL